MKLCERCGIKPVYHPEASYCKECEDRLDSGPLTRLLKGRTGYEARKEANKRNEEIPE
jgi:uncharacterized protein YlaI